MCDQRYFLHIWTDVQWIFYLVSFLPSAGEGVDPQIMQQMAEMLGSQCASEQNRRRPDGVKLLRLMSADYGQLSRIKCIRKRDSVSKGLEVSNTLSD